MMRATWITILTERLDFSHLKQQVNLTHYAAAMGYEIDRKRTTRSSVAMRLGSADKVIISKRGGDWVYCSVFDNRDRGSIFDFIRHRTGKSLPEIGKELQGWMDGHTALPEAGRYMRHMIERKPDPARISRIFRNCQIARDHAYLKTRGIDGAVLTSSRFYERIFQDRFGHAVFPHYKKGYMCALELKGDDTGLFVRGSEKTFWRSNLYAGDNTLVIAEAAIDAISYHILFGLTDAFYMASCGGLSPLQSAILPQMLKRIKQLESIIIATDNNTGGDKLAGQLESVISNAGYKNFIKRHSPDKRGQDWNNVLNEMEV